MMVFYVTCFVPHRGGEVKVSVCVNEKQIKGNTYSVVVSCALSKPSKILDNDSRMGQPCSIGISRNGKWAVTDWSNDCVYLL